MQIVVQIRLPYVHQLKGRTGFYFVRAVPLPLRQAAGQLQWRWKLADSLAEARRRLPESLAETDRRIRVLEHESGLPEADRIALMDADPAALTKLLKEEKPWEAWRNDPEDEKERKQLLFKQKVLRLAGESPQARTKEQLLAMASSIKDPANQTKLNWEKELRTFLDYCGTTIPSQCTKVQASAFRTKLLETNRPSSVKTRLNTLRGLWRVMVDAGWIDENIFDGLQKIKVRRARPIEVDIETVDIKALSLKDKRPDLFLGYLLWRYTGARVAEIAGLRWEDIGTDRITIKAHPTRPLKTPQSERDVPLHPVVKEYLTVNSHWTYRQSQGAIFPTWFWKKEKRWQPPSTFYESVGVSPGKFRHNVATQLRDKGFNEALIGRLLGHTPSTITGGYGTVPWGRLVEAVNQL